MYEAQRQLVAAGPATLSTDFMPVAESRAASNHSAFVFTYLFFSVFVCILWLGSDFQEVSDKISHPKLFRNFSSCNYRIFHPLVSSAAGKEGMAAFPTGHTGLWLCLSLIRDFCLVFNQLACPCWLAKHFVCLIQSSLFRVYDADLHESRLEVKSNLMLQ